MHPAIVPQPSVRNSWSSCALLTVQVTKIDCDSVSHSGLIVSFCAIVQTALLVARSGSHWHEHDMCIVVLLNNYLTTRP